MNGWREKPITEKQKAMIANMMEFSEFPLPHFDGKTRGDASDFIDKYLGLSHQSILNCWDTTQGKG